MFLNILGGIIMPKKKELEEEPEVEEQEEEQEDDDEDYGDLTPPESSPHRFYIKTTPESLSIQVEVSEKQDKLWRDKMEAMVGASLAIFKARGDAKLNLESQRKPEEVPKGYS